MIEKAIIDALAADSTLAGILTEYGSAPAVFAEEAPNDAEMPYLTIRILLNGGPDSIIEQMTLYVDYWDSDDSRVNSKAAAERIEFVLDNAKLEHDRYSAIRVRRFSAGSVPGEDPRDIHYNQQFEIRACRKKWMETLNDVTTTTTAGA